MREVLALPGRWLSGALYSSYFAAGLFFAIDTSRVLEEAGATLAMRYAWAAMLMIGGALGVFSAITDRWIGEYLGLVLLMTVFATYLVAFALTADQSPGRFTAMFLYLSIVIGLVIRWLILRRTLVRASKAMKRQGR